MNHFPFNSEKYRQYHNTFLQKVTIGFDFQLTKVEITKLNELFNDYVQSYFGVSSVGDLNTSICNITRSDLSQSFDFSNKSVVINLNGRNYVGFSDTAIPQILKVRAYFNKVLNIEKISKAGIRKFNVFNVKSGLKNSIDSFQVMRDLYNNDFITSLRDDNLNEDESSIPGLKKCVFHLDDRTITIRTALLPPSKPNDSFYHLMLDTLGELEPIGGIEVDNIVDKLLDFNKDIFDCYHWCVSERVKRVMMQ